MTDQREALAEIYRHMQALMFFEGLDLSEIDIPVRLLPNKPNRPKNLPARLVAIDETSGKYWATISLSDTGERMTVPLQEIRPADAV